MTSTPHLSNPPRIAAALAAALLLGVVPALPAGAQPAVPAAVEQQLNGAAANGPAALLRELEAVLRANPRLAAGPAEASALARIAAAPVGGFVGATLPTYRAITERIADAAPPAQKEAVRNAVAAEIGRVASIDPRPAAAGKPGQTGRETDVAQRGYRVGSFMIYPDIQAATIYDSNIYATRTSKRSDWLATISPQIGIESDWARHSLTASVQTDLTGYARQSKENSFDWNANVEGRIDATETTEILLGLTRINGHEDRTSRDPVEGFTPTPYRELNGYAGVVQRFGDFSVRLGGAAERLTFGNVDSLNGVIDNHDRDRTRYTFGSLVRYEANSAFRPFIEVMGDFRTYDDKQDNFGFARSSGGYRAGLGAQFRLSPTLRGDVFVGAMGRNWQDPRFKSQTQLAVDASLRWQALPGTLLVLYTDRSVEETTFFGSPGYAETAIGGRVEQRLTEKLTGILRVGYSYSDFLQSTRADNDIDSSVGVRYRLTEALTLGLDYRYTQRESNVATSSFNRSMVYFRVGARF